MTEAEIKTLVGRLQKYCGTLAPPIARGLTYEAHRALAVLSDQLEANAALIALLRASLRKVEDEVEGLRRDADASGPVAIAGYMPGAQGFTMATFIASAVPPGTKVYTTPQPTPEAIEALRAAENALARCYDVTEWPCSGESTQDVALAAVRAALANQKEGG